MDFKNSFVAEWYDRTDFFDAIFFCSGHFLLIFSKNDGSKSDPSKKISKMKNQFFHAHQPRAEIYDFCTQQNCNLSFLYWGVHSFAITLYILCMCLFEIHTWYIFFYSIPCCIKYTFFWCLS